MIISIDNKKATLEEVEMMKDCRCLRCKQKLLPTTKRVVFVRLDNKILAWHGLKSFKDGSEYICDYVSKLKPYIPINKRDLTCKQCHKKYRSSIKFNFCSQTCEKKYFHKHIYVLK